ncbi:MAG: hypothetical protein AAB895_00400 [Patescibacteria group bacterium]
MNEQLQREVYSFVKANPQNNFRTIRKEIARENKRDEAEIAREVRTMIDSGYLTPYDDRPLSDSSGLRIKEAGNHKFEEQKSYFETCSHKWVLHVDADKTISTMPGHSLFRCTKCNHYITLSEKAALDGLSSQKESLKIQERNTSISMWANVLAAGTLTVAFLVFLFGQGIL